VCVCVCVFLVFLCLLLFVNLSALTGEIKISIKRSALGVCAVISVVINIHKARDVHNERRAMSCDAVWVQCECSLRKFYYGICYSFLIVESLIKLQARR